MGERAEAGPSRLNVPLMWGETVLNFGKAVVVSEAEPLDLSTSDPVAGALRKRSLEDARAGEQWMRRRAEYATSVAGGTFFPAPVIGYGYGGATRSKNVELTSIRLVRPERALPPSSVPGNAEAVLALKPGESISVKREGATKLFGGNLKTWLDETTGDGTWFAGGPIGAELSIEHRGDATTEVLRGEGNQVRLRVYADGAKGGGFSAGPHIGVYLSWAGTIAYEVARRLRGAEKTAGEMAKMPVWREHTSGAFVDVNGEKGRDCLAEIVLDMSKPAARAAYAAAVRGDLTEARRAVEQPGSGVRVPVSQATDVTKRAVGVSLGLLGLGVSWESAKERHKTVVWADGEALSQSRTIETKTRAATGPTLRRTNRTSWIDHVTTEAGVGKPLPTGIDAKRISVGWASETSDPVTSKEELLRELDFAVALVGDAAPKSARAYRERVAGLEASRFVKIGPRDEGGSTTAMVRMRLARGAAKTLAAIPEEKIFATWVDIVARTEGVSPEWASPEVRAAFDADSSDGKLQWKELTPSYLLRRQDYFDARQLVRSIRWLDAGDEPERNRRLRDLIGVDADRRAKLELLATLLGPDAISVELDIDSDRGPKGEQLDYHFAHAGKQVKARNGLLAYLARAFGVSSATA